MSFDADIAHLIGTFRELEVFTQQEADRAMKRAANHSLRLIKRLTPRSKFTRTHLRTGWKLRKVRVSGRNRIVRYEIYNDDPRATTPMPGTSRTLIDLLEFGTMGRDGDGQNPADKNTQGGGRIRRRDGKLMAWRDHPGKWVVGKEVRGIRPYGMLRRTKADLAMREKAVVAAVKANALKRFTGLRRKK